MSRALFLAALSASACATLSSFGTGISQGQLKAGVELTWFTHNVSASSSSAAITHWWITGGASIDYARIRFYIDGEATASVDLPNIFLACGDGFDDRTAPWGGEHMGKGSSDGGWYNNIRIPFSSSVRVTLTGVADDVLYFIVRGAEDIPVVVGDVVLPPNARLRVDVNDLVMQPLDTLNVINAPDGLQGITFLHTLAFESGTVSPPVTGENCLEGCYHAYSPANAPFPGYIVATGTEDLFDSAYYFAAGEFRQANAGLTRLTVNATSTMMSAYRFMYRDPLAWGPSGGFRFTWRNGDVNDPVTGLKCTSQTGNTNGNPTVAHVRTLGWYYVW